MPLKQKTDNIRKHYKFGIELELFTLDKKGRMVNSADSLIKNVAKVNPGIKLKKECAHNMVELESLPDIYIPDLIEQVVTDLEKVMVIAEEEGTLLYPFGTYPGVFTPTIREDKRYIVQQKLFGKQRFDIAGRCIGLHYHFTLPWGMFDESSKTVKPRIDSKHKESLIHVHNLFVAMDPALITFAQSSPFYQGQFLGKSSRVIVYRGGELFNYPQGLYANFKEFGGLQPYITTNTDLLHAVGKRFLEWKSHLKKIGVNVQTLLKHGSILDTTWNPVKINAHGTIEQRGMDANFPSIIVAIGLTIKYISLLVQQHFVRVEPSDSAIKEPFRYDADKKTIYIPPHTYVRNILQPKAVISGLEDEEVLRLCAGLMRLAKNATPTDRTDLLKPLEMMLSEKQTISDKILARAKSMGVNPKNGITNAEAAELAESFANDLKQDIIGTKDILTRFRLNNAGSLNPHASG